MKARYPELAGVLMYGRPPSTGFANATNGSTPTTENATLSLIRTANQLMLELWPGDPFRGGGARGAGGRNRGEHESEKLSLKFDDGSPCVVKGRATVSCFVEQFGGFNASDSTGIMQAALSSNASHLLIDKPPAAASDMVMSAWIVRPLFLVGVQNMVIEFEPGTLLLAKQDEFHGKDDSLLKVIAVRNVTIDGHGAVLRMRRDDYAIPSRGSCPHCRPYTKAEWRCGLWIQGCEDLTVRDLSIVESGGDGIFIYSGGANHQVPNRRVHIADCILDRNYRQGMSVISAVDLLVERTIMSNTNGTPPAAGVDLEPDLVVESLVNISFIDCQSVDNFGMGFQMFLRAWPNASVAPFSVSLNNFSIIGGKSQGFAVGGVQRGVAGTLDVHNSKCSGTVKSAVFIWDKSATASHVSFANCTFEDSCGLHDQR